MLSANSFSNLATEFNNVPSRNDRTEGIHCFLEKEGFKIILAYDEGLRPQLEVYDKDKRCYVPDLLHTQILKLSEKIGEIIRFGIDNDFIKEMTSSHDDVDDVLYLMEGARPYPVYLLPEKSSCTHIVESLFTQYRVTLQKSGFVDDLDDELLSLGTGAGLAENVVRKEMAERAVILFLRDLDPQSGSVLKVSRARKLFDFVGRIGIEWIRAASRFSALRDTAERILLYPTPKSDPMRKEICDMYSQMMAW